jgi:ubiquinone/menaquinone biosynthesis C-methylase UbiE
MIDVDDKQLKNDHSTAGTTGRVLHSAALYDVLAWLFLRGREGLFREKLLDLARLRAGETVLDVGCGTGTLAIAAKRRVGPSGAVRGIDASPAMIARATKKARTRGVEVVFQNAIVEALPHPDRYFDAVLSTLMLHHLPRNTRQRCAREMRRVLKPDGGCSLLTSENPRRSVEASSRTYIGMVTFRSVTSSRCCAMPD